MVERSAGFTLLELLVVIGIMATLAAMVAFLPTGLKRDAEVKSAAEELAATIRLARSIAMERQVVCGVAFHLRNAGSTSGRVLNNNDGGHWYRIVGAWEDTTLEGGNGAKDTATPPRPHFWGANTSVANFLEQVEASWIGDKHLLPANRVRFLALTDQDNGAHVDYSSNSWKQFPDTYPRPWFGRYDVVEGRLYPWGGYDPDLLDRNGRACSGFYFQGEDGPLSGCRNPSDRFTGYTGAPTKRLFTAGEARPLINDRWLDFFLTCYPDGTIGQGYNADRPNGQADGNILYARTQTKARSGNAGGGGTWGDLGDLTSGSGTNVMESYANHTGGYWITLCPDVIEDTDRFATADQALATMWPAYRVHVNRFGAVSVHRVANSQPAGVTWDTTITGVGWQNANLTKTYYRENVATNPDGTLRAMPVSDWLTPELLASDNWWMATP